MEEASRRTNVDDGFHAEYCSAQLTLTPVRRVPTKEGERDPSNSEAPTRAPQPSDRRRITSLVLVPTTFVVILTAGLATLFLLWLATHRISGGKTLIQEGAFIVNEGTKAGKPNDAQFWGLTISAITSHFISIATPLAMTLLSYRIAASWIASQRTLARETRTLPPTPLQYGLLNRLLGSGSIFALWDSATYLLRRDPIRPVVPNILRTSFFFGLIIYALTHAVG
ncbi:hypothetical protein JAAARDRAFT_198133 [Jaapia argillacea MUCL 33604]|uniref:Uncharacterized protein n=1 Tax=Jaapia argillacea MUCL 33604 TaxID=933084 RepID=A0A067PF85_9AGAM|nr:hypothetical protein JAAARDRAFT_198133 [Jaapia argillacea MUCL 33604]